MNTESGDSKTRIRQNKQNRQAYKNCKYKTREQKARIPESCHQIRRYLAETAGEKKLYSDFLRCGLSDRGKRCMSQKMMNDELQIRIERDRQHPPTTRHAF